MADEFESVDGIESGSELAELSDSDYDPQDIEDLEQVQADLDEDVFDSEESVVLEYGAGVEEESGSELDELSDSDYDPKDIEDLEQVQADLDEDVFDSEE